MPVFVRVPHGDGATGVWVRTTPDAEPHLLRGRIDRSTAWETWWRCDVDVRNPLTNYRFLLDGGPGGYRWLNGTGLHPHDVTDAERLPALHLPAARLGRRRDRLPDFPGSLRPLGGGGRPAAARVGPAGRVGRPGRVPGYGAPRQLFGGDLDGIVEHLDHIASIGADTIYLTPFFPAESNHRYNAASFDEVDPLLGGDKALARLSQEVHARGWRLLGDLTTNHCGDTHAWFRRAREDRDSPERGFFYFPGPHDDAYEGWLGHSTLPKFRFSSAELRRRLIAGADSVAGRWLRPPFGLDGWRVDVANMTGRHAADDFNAEVAAALRATMAEQRPDGLLLAEHSHDATATWPATGGTGR